MSTVAAVRFEYRCMRCFQALYATTDETGTTSTCPYCGQDTTVPAATPERIERAKEVADQPAAGEVATTVSAPASPNWSPSEKEWTDADIEEELKKQLHVEPGEMVTLSTITSSRIKRFLGLIIDSMLMATATVAGFLLLLLLSSLGLIDAEVMRDGYEGVAFLTLINTISVVYFLPFALCLFQWWLIATRGQSIAKFLLGMRIVTDGGRNPGFLQAVVLRNWVRALLNMLPFFALLDAAFIINDSRRCIHDLIANTYVVDV